MAQAHAIVIALVLLVCAAWLVVSALLDAGNRNEDDEVDDGLD